MMRRFYALIALLVALLMPTYAWEDNLKVADTFEADGITYMITKLSPMEVVVGTDPWYDGNYHDNLFNHRAVKQDTIGKIIVPSEIEAPDGNLYTVTSIGHRAFRFCEKITEVVLPSTITLIPDQSFEGCSNLTVINLPESITEIGTQAFSKCRLTSIVIPNSVTTIKEYTFAHNIDLISLVLSNSLTEIEEGAFYNCHNLPSITIPNSVTKIGRSAFEDCDGLVEIRSNIKEPFPIVFDLDYVTFENCDATLYIPIGTKAKYEATEGWKEFKNIVEMTPYDVLGDNTVAAHFLEPDEEGKIEIPETVEIDGKTYTVTEIAANAFKDNKELTEVTIPGTVTTIGDGAFAGCENLRAIYVFAPEPISLTAAEARSIVTRAAENVPSQFEGIDFDACTLYVPIGSEQKYRDAEGWKLFVNIVGVEDPAGIATVYTEQNGNEPIYNLSGQRLAAPRRGLNIIGGRKVVMK